MSSALLGTPEGRASSKWDETDGKNAKARQQAFAGLHQRQKVDVSNILGLAKEARILKTVLVRYNGVQYGIQVDNALGKVIDLKKEIEKQTMVRVKRQVIKELEGIHDNTLVNQLPPYILGKQLLLTGDASVSITDACDTGDADFGPKQREISKVNAKQSGRLRNPNERSEEHRKVGNDYFKIGAWEQALDMYTRAINALPDDAKALCNRSACWAYLERYKEALFDADQAIFYDPLWAKGWSRKGYAHFQLKQYDESVRAYDEGMKLAPQNQDMADGRERAEKAGGDAKRAIERARLLAEEKRKRDQETLKKHGLDGKFKSLDENAQYEIQKQQYQEELHRLRRDRRVAIELWIRSTRTEMTKPEMDHNSCPYVDIFQTLRGQCRKTGCKMWYRDIRNIMNAWNDTTVLLCETCGADHRDHEDCGKYEPMDPKPPQPPGRRKQEVIQGVYDGSGFNGKDFGDKTEERMAQADSGGMSTADLFAKQSEEGEAVGKSNGFAEPKKEGKNPMEGQVLTTADFQKNAVEREELPDNCDVFGNLLGACLDCGSDKCAEYCRPVREKKFNPMGITVDFNDTGMLECGCCGCSVLRHENLGKHSSWSKTDK